MIAVLRTGAATVPSNRFMGVRSAGNGQYIAQVGCDLSCEILLQVCGVQTQMPQGACHSLHCMGCVR